MFGHGQLLGTLTLINLKLTPIFNLILIFEFNLNLTF
jgi:hypothetical protein